jgi:long-chain fatty acid transport protein
MAGTSLARPQDVPSSIFGNPSTLAQFHGTHFTMGGGWVEGYPTVTHDGFLDNAAGYSVTSRTQGMLAPAIGVAQDLRPLGLPGTLGLGFTSQSGLGAEFRGLAPAGSYANDISSEYMVLGLNLGAGVELTERLSVGAAMTLGTGIEQLGLVQTSAMVHAYGLRGAVGVDYDLTDATTLAAFYQSKLGFNFPNAFRLPNGTYRGLHIQQPDTIGFGIANRRLLDGDLLLACDVYYKLWESADMYRDIFVNQWALSTGAQLTRGKMKYRLGYSYNTNPINHNVGDRLSTLPVAQAAVEFFQAATSAVINQHRISGGFGCENFLLQGLDLDFFAGGLLNASDNFGDHTRASVAVYYLGMGLTWRYGCSHRE